MKSTLLLALLLSSLSASAQPEQAASVSATGSNRPIPLSDQLFRKSVWRAIDLREKQNQPMFSESREISRIIIEAVKHGELTAYRSDSLTATFTRQQVLANMSFTEGSDELSPAERLANITVNNAGDDWGNQPAAAKPGTYEYRYKDLYQLELKEEMIFDKKRSRMYHDIKSITLLLPSTLPTNVSGIEKPIGTFKYSDLVRVFRRHPETAVWFNAQNDAQHHNLADAFELWLFNSYITKVSNPSDSRLSEVFGGEQQGILAAQQTAADMVEYEFNLWSF